MITKFINANILTMNRNFDIIQNGEIIVCENLIKYIGNNFENIRVDKVVDMQGDIVLPAFINSFCHPYFLREDKAIIDNYKNSCEIANDFISENQLLLKEFNAKEIENKLKYNGTLTNILLDEKHNFDIKTITIDGLKEYNFNQLREYTKKIISEDKKLILYLQNIYLMNDEHFICINKLAKEFNLLVVTHIAETLKEAGTCDMQNGCSPINFLENYGLFDRKCLLIGCNILEKDEIEYLSQYENVCIGLTFDNNIMLGNTIPQITTILKNNIKIVLGFNNLGISSFDMFKELFLVKNLQNSILTTSESINAVDCFKMCFTNPAEVFDLSCGILEEGRLANFISIDNSVIKNINNIYFDIINFANQSKINIIVENGNIIKNNR